MSDHHTRCKAYNFISVGFAPDKCPYCRIEVLTEGLEAWRGLANNFNALLGEANIKLEQRMEEIDRYREALEIIAGYKQCADNLMSNVDVAIEILGKDRHETKA